MNVNASALTHNFSGDKGAVFCKVENANLMNPLHRIWLKGMLGWLLVAMMGCYPAYGPLMVVLDGGTEQSFYERTPQMRMGGLLFPALIWPLSVADPADLGQHAYRLGPLPPLRLTETSRGIIYTRKAGFIDLAHIRNSIDLTYYAYQRLLPALKEMRTYLVLTSAEPSLYHIRINYPEWWQSQTPELREKSAVTLARGMSQRMSYIMMTWHEIISWYGYRSTLIAGEKWSAFSSDDMASHLLGTEIAAVFLDLPEEAFETAVTGALSRRLADLEALAPSQTRRAVDLVENVWWDFSKQDLLRRQVEIRLDGEPLHPWLIDELSPNVTAAALILPTLEDVEGRDCRDMVRVEIVPNVLEAYAIREDLKTAASNINPEIDFARLAEHIRDVETKQLR